MIFRSKCPLASVDIQLVASNDCYGEPYLILHVGNTYAKVYKLINVYKYKYKYKYKYIYINIYINIMLSVLVRIVLNA